MKGVMREGGGGERKREGRCQMQGGRQEGGRHARAHSLYCPRAAEGEVRKRKEKKGKNPAGVNPARTFLSPLCQQVITSE